MPGYILLEGGAEFGGQMAVPDAQALAAAGDPSIPVVIIPAAAAPDHNDVRAGQNGVRWFRRLGAQRVEVLPLVDRASANDPVIAAKLGQAGLILLLGGFPTHLAESLRGSMGWEAMLAAYDAGAVIAGSSAGAMVLCDHYYDPAAGKVMKGLGLLSGICVIPHHATFGSQWVPALEKALPDSLLLGIDEETGAFTRGGSGSWQVLGKGHITVYAKEAPLPREHGETFRIDPEG